MVESQFELGRIQKKLKALPEMDRPVNRLNRKMVRQVAKLADDAELSAQARVGEWIYGPGLPDNVIDVQPRAFAAVDRSVELWRAGTAAKDLATADWTTHHWRRFLSQLPEDLSLEEMYELDGAFGLTKTGNAEVLVPWLELSVERGYAPARPTLEAFLTSVGRLKFLYPLYSRLAASEDDRVWAEAVYARARSGYHPVTIGALDRVLDWQSTADTGR